LRGVGEKSSLSRIIKAPESIDENSCAPHLFPQLVDGESAKELLPGDKHNDFRPVCPQAANNSNKGRFDVLFQENEGPSASDQSEADLAEIHANELKESFSKGFIEGENSGILTERQRIEPALEALQASTEELKKCQTSLIAHFERASVELAIAIAEKIVCHEVSVNQKTIVDVLKKAANETDKSEILTIRINPSDLQFIEEAGCSLSDLRAENATLEGDSAVPSGGCVIQTDFGCVDSIIDHQLEAVAEALRDKF
jgi:flagellar biosynthesis/type III secretory pathway protein FliH